MYTGSYEMPICNSCSKEITPGEISENFNCPNCKNEKIWRCEECKAKSKKYHCRGCGYKSH